MAFFKETVVLISFCLPAYGFEAASKIHFKDIPAESKIQIKHSKDIPLETQSQAKNAKAVFSGFPARTKKGRPDQLVDRQREPSVSPPAQKKGRPDAQSTVVKPQTVLALSSRKESLDLQLNKVKPQTKKTGPARASNPLDLQPNKTTPQAKGLILAFKRWPKGKEKSSLLERLKKAGLKKRSEYEMFKTWVFEWPDFQKAERAEKLCGEFSNLSFLDYCEPDYLLKPATGEQRMEIVEKEAPPPKGPKLRPPPIPSDPNHGGNVKSCNIVATQLNLFKGRLGDYWAQERVGADLLKEELKKAPPIKKHLVAVFDVFDDKHVRVLGPHGMGVKNIIAGSGPQAALPPLGANMSYADATLASSYLDHANHYLKTVDKTCGNRETKSQSPPDAPGQDPNNWR